MHVVSLDFLKTDYIGFLLRQSGKEALITAERIPFVFMVIMRIA
jgi:hypothetical protein